MAFAPHDKRLHPARHPEACELTYCVNVTGASQAQAKQLVDLIHVEVNTIPAGLQAGLGEVWGQYKVYGARNTT